MCGKGNPVPPLIGGEGGSEALNLTTHQINCVGGMPTSTHVKCDTFDQGLFSACGKMVQFTDASESAVYIHMNGPRHISPKSIIPSSNCCCLASIIQE
jgi:hypothetical protein